MQFFATRTNCLLLIGPADQVKRQQASTMRINSPIHWLIRPSWPSGHWALWGWVHPRIRITKQTVSKKRWGKNAVQLGRFGHLVGRRQMTWRFGWVNQRATHVKDGAMRITNPMTTGLQGYYLVLTRFWYSNYSITWFLWYNVHKGAENKSWKILV